MLLFGVHRTFEPQRQTELARKMLEEMESIDPPTPQLIFTSSPPRMGPLLLQGTPSQDDPNIAAATATVPEPRHSGEDDRSYQLRVDAINRP